MTEKFAISNNNISKKKLLLVKAMERSLGNVTMACKMVKCNRTTFYEYYNKDPEFKKAIDSVEFEEVKLDFVEGKLMKLINEEIPSAIFFYLNNRGQSRGYNLRNNTTPQNDDIIIDDQTCEIIESE
jgi:hypothetical protein